MGRLENFIPNLKPHKIQENKTIAVIEFEAGKSFPVEEQVLPFLKQIKGHLSLREIFLYLNSQLIDFSISKSLSVLEHIASQDLLTNCDDYYHLKNHQGESKHAINPSVLTESYFSEERLIGLIQKTTLFLECDRKTAVQILKHSSLEQIEENVRLIRQGTKSSDFFVLLAGEVGVFRGRECLAELTPLSVFGESAAIFDKVRNADVITTQSSWILKIDASRLVDTNSPDSFEAYKGLKSRLILNQTLAANPLFRNLPTDVMQFFISKCRIEKYSREQTVIEQDETSGDFYFILQGSVSVIKDGMPVTSLGEGDHFGEIAAMFNEPRTASIMTEIACTFLVLNQRSLFEVLCSHFRLASDIEKTALKRKNSTGNLLEIFDEDPADIDENTDVIDDDEFTGTELQIDPDFLEVSRSNFDMEVFDFSNSGSDSDDDT